jgi:hypothetical protein
VPRQAELFENITNLPEGIRYQKDLISANDERRLLDELPLLPFKKLDFHGFLGQRRTVSFGWHYDFDGGGLKQAGKLPDFLTSLRNCALYSQISIPPHSSTHW